MMMGHARQGVHSMGRDDSFPLSLQRGESDIYLNRDDAQARHVPDGDLIRVFNDLGSFVAKAHAFASIQPECGSCITAGIPCVPCAQELFGGHLDCCSHQADHHGRGLRASGLPAAGIRTQSDL